MTVRAGDEGSARLRNFFQCENAAGRVFRWSEPVATIDLRLPRDDYIVRLDTAALRGCTSRLPIAIFWNDEQIADRDVVASGPEVWFRVPRHRCLEGWSQRMMLVVEPLAAASPDTRHLGLPLVDLQVFAEAIRALPEGRSGAGRRLFGRRKKSWQGPAPHLPTWAIKGMRTLHAPDLSSSSECSYPAPMSADAASEPPRVACDAVVVAPDEINSRHGTGLLLQYMFPNLRGMAVVQSSDFSAGDPVPTAVTWKLPAGLSRMETYRRVYDWFHHSPPSRAYVVPYQPHDLQAALALRHLFGTRLVLHVMDDNTLVSHGIPSSLMAEVITNSEVRFAISPEMRTMYEQRFGRKFYLLPPVVARGLVEVPFALQATTPERGVIIGNVWSAEWIDHMVRTIRDSGVELDWFCNNPKIPWVADNRRRLVEAGIFVREPLWGEELVRELRRRPFLVLPTGLPTDRSARAIAELSLPSRVVFHAAAVRTPILVLGGASTAVARFVERFELGGVAPYEPEAVREAVAKLSDAETVRKIRATCDRIAPHFTAGDVERWIWNSMEAGRPADERFESLWPPENALADYVPPDPPHDMAWPRHPAWQMLARYARNGGRPRTILDIGASTGMWSQMAASVFPESHFVLCEPLFSRYPDHACRYYLDGLPGYEVIEKGVTNTCGQASILASDSLYGSSLLAVDDVHGGVHRVSIDCITVDALDELRNWDGPIFLKADVQFAEHLVIEGAARTLQTKVDAVFLELSFARGHEQAKTHGEMCSLMDDLGFELFDEAEGWRDPRTGKLEQKDVLFVRKKTGLSELPTGRGGP